MTDHLLELRILADKGRLEDLSRMLELAYEEARLQLAIRRGGRMSAR